MYTKRPSPDISTLTISSGTFVICARRFRPREPPGLVRDSVGLVQKISEQLGVEKLIPDVLPDNVEVR